MADDRTTKPTIETVLERMAAFEEKFERRIDHLEKKADERFDQFEKKNEGRFDKFGQRTNERFDKLEDEIDRLTIVAYSTKAHMSELRLEFREWRAQMKESLPVQQEQ